MIVKSFNPVTDKEINYNWKTYEFPVNYQNNNELKARLICFIESTKIDIKIPSKFENHNYCIDPLDIEAIICYKDNTKEEITWNHFFKNNRITINGKAFSSTKWAKVEKIIFHDVIHLHPAVRSFWNKDGFCFVKSVDIRKEIKNKLLLIA